MNLGFAKWVRSRGRDHGDDVRIMFHEIAFPWVWWPLHHNLIAFFNQLMARELILAASSIYVSIAAWSRLLTKLGAVASKIQLLPIPSNVPRADVQKAMKMRDSILGTGSPTKLVGHFGTYGKWVGRLLFPIAIAMFTAVAAVLGIVSVILALVCKLCARYWRRRARARTFTRAMTKRSIPTFTIIVVSSSSLPGC